MIDDDEIEARLRRTFDAVARRAVVTRAEPGPRVVGFRRRSLQWRPRPLVVAVASIVAIAVGSVAVASWIGDGSKAPHIAVSPTTTTVPDREWCVGFSHDAALAQGLSYGSVIVDEPVLRAKLVSLAELLHGTNNPFVPAEPDAHVSNHKKFWVVELRPTAKSQSPYKWGLVAIDANTGAVVTADMGPSSGGGAVAEPAVEPPYFDALPDHSIECPDGASVGTSTTTTTIDPVTEALLQGRHEYDPRVDLAVHAQLNAINSDATVDPNAETVLMTGPGPEGTELKLWTYWPDETTGCVGVVDSAPGSGGPRLPVVDLVQCGDKTINGDLLESLPPPITDHVILSGAGEDWTSPSGHAYPLWWERDTLNTKHVQLVFADGTTQNVTPVAGFWMAYFTIAQSQQYRVIYSDANGHVIDSRTIDLVCPPGGQCGGS